MQMIPNVSALVAAGVVWIPIILFAPERDFIVIRDLSYKDGVVIFDRAIRKPNTVADWTVTIVNAETGEQVCKGGGRDEYTTEEPTLKRYDLDFFTHDQGCEEKLLPGDYTGYVAWNPIDGRTTVAKSFDIEIGD